MVGSSLTTPNDSGNLTPGNCGRIGQVVIWGNLYEEVCKQVAQASKRLMQEAAVKEYSKGTPLGDVSSSVLNQTTIHQTEGKDSNMENDVASEKASTKRNGRKRRNPELMTKAEHLRILRSAVQNTLKLIEEHKNNGAVRRISTRSMTRRISDQANGIDSGFNSSLIDGSPDNGLQGDENRLPRRKRNQEGVRSSITYTELLETALNENPEGMTVSEIYAWISARNEAFPMSDARWKNSVRHNLSINEIFQKSSKTEGKTGHVWTLSKHDEPTTVNKEQKNEQQICNAVTPNDPATPIKKPKRQYKKKPKATVEHSYLNEEFNNIVQSLHQAILMKAEPQAQEVHTYNEVSGYASYIQAKLESPDAIIAYEQDGSFEMQGPSFLSSSYGELNLDDSCLLNMEDLSLVSGDRTVYLEPVDQATATMLEQYRSASEGPCSFDQLSNQGITTFNLNADLASSNLTYVNHENADA